jgi:hypothetical protein
MAAKTLITAARVRELISYDPETGIFIWIGSKQKPRNGTVAGGPHVCGYVWMRLDNIHYMAHRLAWIYMTSRWPIADIDHINTERSDNRWCNLREATRSQNRANSRKPITNTSGFKGATKAGNRWVAQIWQSGKMNYLGRYDTAKLANDAYLRAAIEHHGEYARG